MKTKQNDKTQVQKTYDILKKTNVISAIDYDSDTTTNCNEGCNPYCRCGTISNFRVKSVDRFHLNNSIMDALKITDKLDRYIVDRLICSLKISGESFEPNITGGYYGEELHGAYLDRNTITRIDVVIKKFLQCNDITSKVRLYLTEEYGYILGSLANSQFVIKKNIKKSQIIMKNDEYVKRLSSADIEIAKRYPHDIKCLCIPVSESQYRLIDGYHRFTALPENEVFSIITITK